MSDTFDLEAEIRDLAARRDLAAIAARYARGLDRLDAPLVRSAFHDDAWIDTGGFKGGPDAFVAYCMDFLGAMGGSQHLLGQSIITIDGNRAQGEVYFQAWHAARLAADAPTDLFIAGRYIDEYARREGEWRIAKRLLISDWATNAPADSFLDASPGSNRLGRRGEDFSERRDWPG